MVKDKAFTAASCDCPKIHWLALSLQPRSRACESPWMRRQRSETRLLASSLSAVRKPYYGGTGTFALEACVANPTCDIDVRDIQGRTALHLVTEPFLQSWMKLLIKYATNDSGEFRTVLFELVTIQHDDLDSEKGFPMAHEVASISESSLGG